MDEHDIGVVVRPELDAPVFVRIRRNLGDVNLMDNVALPFMKDDVFVLRYRFIRDLLHRGQVELF